MTVEEFFEIDDWDPGYRYELVRGVLIVVPPPGAGERSPNSYLGHLFLTYRDSHSNGGHLDCNLPEQEIRTSAGVRRADHAVWCGLGRRPVPADDTPTIAVEFVSQSSRDRRRDYVEKRHEYAEAGVGEYWVIDRFQRLMTVFRGTDEEIVIGENESYATPLLPGFELALRTLLAEADPFDQPGTP